MRKESMRIIQLTPGSGDNFYCENCLRDLALVRAFQRAGHEIMMVPMYLPIDTGAGPFPEQAPIFFGGVNVYLQQKLGLFRKTPRWLDKCFDNSLLLKGVGKLAGMTSAKDLGQTTVSMLQGCDGRQEKELLRLVDWLAAMGPKPDVIVVSNILLAGLAGPLKEKLGIPVVCLLQDEEGFLDTLPELYAEQSWQLVAQNAAAFDALVCVSKYYQQVMRDRLKIGIERMPVIPVGVDPATYEPAHEPPAVPTIGFLARMCHDHGLDILINTVHLLKWDNRLKHIRLRMSGGKSPSDAVFLKKMQNRIKALRLSDSVECVDDYDGPSRKKFLQSLSVMTLPSRKPMAYGLFAMEACACGVPFVVPQTGVFPELAAKTRAGVVYEPNNPVRLAEALRPLLTDPKAIQQLGQKGRQAVEGDYSIDKTVERMVDLFNKLQR
jgi:glycosyltransferase involved in cell wall biosynthesis